MNILDQIKLEDNLIRLFSLSVIAIFVLTAAKPATITTKAKNKTPKKNEIHNFNGNNLPKSKQKDPIRSYWVVATAYSSEVGQTDDSPCIPSKADFNLCEHYKKHKIEDTIAANFLPLGAKVKFPELYGDKVFTVRDRMNERYNGTARIDFWKSHTSEAENFGVKSVKMEIIKY
ncbi:MAG: hypothetical protein ABEJ24_00250 [Candidatus Magasanikbacteria bacterium]